MVGILQLPERGNTFFKRLHKDVKEKVEVVESNIQKFKYHHAIQLPMQPYFWSVMHNYSDYTINLYFSVTHSVHSTRELNSDYMIRPINAKFKFI